MNEARVEELRQIYEPFVDIDPEAADVIGLIVEVEQLQAENDELLQAMIDLLSPWWIMSNRYCYWCGDHPKTNLHTDDCPRQRATRLLKKLRSKS